ncbi:MAG: RsmE family RNA methyltransferase [Verrucomicrobiota bacterium]
MHRFHSTPDRCAAPIFSLADAEARHASQVLRLEAGDRVEVIDGRGGLIEAEILVSGRRGVEVRALHRQLQARAPGNLVLCQALLKGKALETVLEKSVELGASRVVLLETERCVARVPAEEAERKRSSWSQTLIEDAQQSRHAWLPELVGPLPLAPALEGLGPANRTRLLVASLEPGTPPLGAVLRSLPTGLDDDSLAVAIGPEGDFSPAELERFRAAGAHSASLGPLILRAETAAIAALAILADVARGWRSGVRLPATNLGHSHPSSPSPT